MTGIGNRTEEGLALEQSARLRMELPGASLRGVGLFGANLSYVWFQNADLSYAYLYVANLSFANFLGANFRVREPSRLRKKVTPTDSDSFRPWVDSRSLVLQRRIVG